MQARAAYIRSFGTTGILVAAALLMLATVGALVAYDGWPERTVGEPVTSVPVQTLPDARAARGVRRTPPAAAKLVARAAASAAATTPVPGLVRVAAAGGASGGASTVGLVKVPPRPATPEAADPAATAAPPPVLEPVPLPATEPLPPLEVPLAEVVTAPVEIVTAPVEGEDQLTVDALDPPLPAADDAPSDTPLAMDLGDLALPLP